MNFAHSSFARTTTPASHRQAIILPEENNMKLCKILLVFAALSLVFVMASASQAKDPDKAEQKLLGKHMFSLQWILDETNYGTAIVKRNKNGGLYVDARQESKGDYVTLSGEVRVVNAKEFTVTGDLVTCVSYINGGKPCPRSGTFTFKATGNRKYWRMQEMTNPCENVLDYVDIYF